MSHSVLAHLINRFSVHPENLATEALNFILGRSAAARGALSRIVQSLGYPLEGELRYTTQVHDAEKGRPDLVGRAADGRVRVIIEAKFWAGLTDNQPVGYLTGGLAQAGPVCLLFLAPKLRQEVLWPKVKSLCIDAGLTTSSTNSHDARSQACVVGQHVLALADWGSTLRALITACSDADERDSKSDLLQLLALCEEQETVAFLPLHQEELTGTLGRRIVQFEQLVAALTERLGSNPAVGDLRQLRASNAAGAHYTRYIRLRGYPAMLRFHPGLWARHGSAPIWVAFAQYTWGPAAPVPTKIRESLNAVPAEFLEAEGYLHVPLQVPTGRDEADVLAALEMQVIQLLHKLPAPPFEAACNSVMSPVDNEPGS